jgi:hypothetical protein
MIKKLPLLFILLSFCVHFTYAQVGNTAIKDDEKLLQFYQSKILQQYLSDSAAYKGEHKKYFVKIYRERYDYLLEMFTGKEIITAPEEHNYLQELVLEILKSNPALSALNPRILFTRAYWPNAASTGEGTIVFNIGLFSRLQNEAQVAFVLCHELAHLYLNHSNKKIDQYVNTVYSDEFQKELKKIKKMQYEQNKRLTALEKNIAFKSRRHSRDSESEADSMALEFLKPTRFDKKEAVQLLALLDSIDKENFNALQELPKLFNFSTFPFKSNWIKKETGFFGGQVSQELSEKEMDSLKTHPACKQRISQLQPKTEALTKASKFVVSEQKFTELKSRFRYEIIAHLFHKKNISRSLFYALELLEEKPKDIFLITTIGNCLNLLYAHQKEHTLGTIADLPSPYADKNYNSLLHFIQELKLSDVAAISYKFMEQYEGEFTGEEPFAAVLKKSKENFLQ